jgi:hypothetical protein
MRIEKAREVAEGANEPMDGVVVADSGSAEGAIAQEVGRLTELGKLVPERLRFVQQSLGSPHQPRISGHFLHRSLLWARLSTKDALPSRLVRGQRRARVVP